MGNYGNHATCNKAAFEETFDNTVESYETLWDATIDCVVRELSTALEVLTHTDQGQFIAKVEATTNRIERCSALLKRMISLYEDVDELRREVAPK